MVSEDSRPRVIRLAFLVGVVAVNLGVAQWMVAPAPFLGVIPSVRLAAAVTLWANAGMTLYMVGRARCGLPSVVKEVPAMSLPSVVVYIYGLGCVVFAMFLASMGVSSSSTLNFACGMMVVCVSDTVERGGESWLRRVLGVVTGVCSVTAVHLVAHSDPLFGDYSNSMEAGDAGTVVYSFVIPLGAPLVFYFARGRPSCTPALVRELVVLAFPFAVVLSVLALWLLPSDASPLGAIAAPAALLSLTGGVVLFFGVHTAMLFSTVDFLCALSLALSVKSFALGPESAPDALLAVCFSGLAFLFRLWACLQEDEPLPKTGAPIPADPCV